MSSVFKNYVSKMGIADYYGGMIHPVYLTVSDTRIMDELMRQRAKINDKNTYFYAVSCLISCAF